MFTPLQELPVTFAVRDSLMRNPLPFVRRTLSAGIYLGLIPLSISLSIGTAAQQPTAQSTSPQAAASPATAAAPSVKSGRERPADAHEPTPVAESELKQLLVGKVLYIRGGHLGDSLHYDMHGQLVDHGSQVPYTLSLVEINKISMNKHKVELEGIRYGLHFEDALPTVDPMLAADKVRITPKKKTLKIAIDREEIEKLKKDKVKKSKTKRSIETTPAQEANAELTPQKPMPEATASHDPRKTTSVAEANQAIRDALDKVFAHGLDDQMMASLPDFWKLYYQEAAAGTDYHPNNPAIFRQSNVDQKAKLLTTFEPPSNDFAQASGVAGIAVYHVVLGADGKPQEIAAARPIGFGLDENAVASIRKASFQPAIKDGKPVPVLLDMIVQFRIYSKRTSVVNTAEASKTTLENPSLPGPYSVRQP